MANEKVPKNENHKTSNPKSIKFAPQSFPHKPKTISSPNPASKSLLPRRLSRISLLACSLLSNHGPRDCTMLDS